MFGVVGCLFTVHTFCLSISMFGGELLCPVNYDTLSMFGIDFMDMVCVISVEWSECQFLQHNMTGFSRSRFIFKVADSFESDTSSWKSSIRRKQQLQRNSHPWLCSIMYVVTQNKTTKESVRIKTEVSMKSYVIVRGKFIIQRKAV